MPTTITGTNISLTSGGNTLSMGPTAAVAKAWVNFNGTGTVAIRASSNVSSITDDGTGRYRVNFTSAMTDTNYATVVTGLEGAVNGVISMVSNTQIYATSSVPIAINQASNGGAYDPSGVYVLVFR